MEYHDIKNQTAVTASSGLKWQKLAYYYRGEVFVQPLEFTHSLLNLCVLQELALYNEFTIGDTLTFFGRIHGLTQKETKARMDFLIDFLDLPQKTSLVRNLR